MSRFYLRASDSGSFYFTLEAATTTRKTPTTQIMKFSMMDFLS